MNICPDKRKEFIDRAIKTKKLYCLDTQSSSSIYKVTEKTARDVSMCKFCFNVKKLYFVACEDST